MKKFYGIVFIGAALVAFVYGSIVNEAVRYLCAWLMILVVGGWLSHSVNK
jgi:hypothetical protein